MIKINIQNLCLKFRRYHEQTSSLKDIFANLFKKKKHSAYSDFWALQDISLTISDGERVGIIGHNGSGKSTFLRTLCKVYKPTSGYVSVTGKIASLLEIGVGFHPEFTGRENLRLSAAILGYSKSQTKNIENEVIRSSGIVDFIDTPIKYYSTGMHLRLAFSLATTLNPDILVLDEMFAGGDEMFIKQARTKMETLINSARVFVFVSHDMDLIKKYCTRVLWFDKGRLVRDGNPHIIVDEYKKFSS